MKYLLVALSIVILYASYNYVKINDLSNSVDFYNDENCSALISNGLSAPEDMVKLDDKYLITVSGYYPHLTLIPDYGIEKAPSGNIFLINTEEKEIIKLKIEGFPKNLKIHALGINLFINQNGSKLLYVINNTYSKGGQRVEVFEIFSDELIAKYKRHFRFDDSFMGRLNDIAVLSDDEFYVTTYIPYPDNPDGSRNIITQLLSTYIINLFMIKMTSIYYCKNSLTSNEIDCVQIPGTDGMYNNGIAYVKEKNALYVVDTLAKLLRVFKLDPNNYENLYIKEEFSTKYALDNINYDESKKILHFGVIGKVNELFSLENKIKEIGALPEKFENHSGSGYFNLETKEFTYTVMQGEMYGTSTSYHIGDNVFMSSWCDEKILVCKYK